METSKRQRRYSLALAGLILLHLVSSGLAIRRDGVTLVADGADYWVWSFQVGKALRHGELGRALRLLWANPQRPPLAIVPAALAQAAVGRPAPMAGRLSTLCWMALLLWATYQIGRRLCSPAAGLVAAAALAATPQVMGFSRMLWVDVPAAAMAAVVVLALLRTDHFRLLRPSLLAGLCLGLALLTKHALPLYLAPLGAGVLLVGLRRRGERTRTLKHAGLCAAVAVAVFALWGAFQWVQLKTAVRMAQPGAVEQVDRELGTRATASAQPHPGLAFYLGRLPTSIAGPALTALFLAGLGLLVWRDRRAAVAVALLWLGGSLVLLDLFVPWERYILPALPAMALVIGAGLGAIPGLDRRAWAVPLAVGCLTLYALQQTWTEPLLTRCGHDRPAERVFCAGMVRPLPVPARAFQLAMPLGGHPAAAVPSFLRPPAPPLDHIPAALKQWLVQDTAAPAEVEPLAEIPRLDPAVLGQFALVAVVEPGPGMEIPLEQQERHRQVRALLRQEPRRWTLAAEHRLPRRTRLQIYRNARPVPLPGPPAIW